jgi:hypothetical protein
MCDYTHLTNVIQGAVIQITERRPLSDQPALLEEMIEFLSDQRQSIIVTKMKAAEELARIQDSLFET